MAHQKPLDVTHGQHIVPKLPITLSSGYCFCFRLTDYNIFLAADRPSLHSKSMAKASKGLILINMQPDFRPCRRQQRLEKNNVKLRTQYDESTNGILQTTIKNNAIRRFHCRNLTILHGLTIHPPTSCSRPVTIIWFRYGFP